MLRLTQTHPHLWGWITAILSIILLIAAIVCWLYWDNAQAAWLMLAPLVVVWPGCTIKVLERAVSERKTDVRHQ